MYITNNYYQTHELDVTGKIIFLNNDFNNKH